MGSMVGIAATATAGATADAGGGASVSGSIEWGTGSCHVNCLGCCRVFFVRISVRWGCC